MIIASSGSKERAETTAFMAEAAYEIGCDYSRPTLSFISWLPYLYNTVRGWWCPLSFWKLPSQERKHWYRAAATTMERLAKQEADILSHGIWNQLKDDALPGDSIGQCGE